jgi:streptomycin 6-kinase
METTVDLLNKVNGFNEISEYMQDEELTQTLALVAKLISKPDVPAAVGVELIVKLQAYSSKFAMLASWYTNVKKDERAKKNIYYSAKEATDRLVDSLKYLVRINNG